MKEVLKDPKPNTGEKSATGLKTYGYRDNKNILLYDETVDGGSMVQNYRRQLRTGR